MTTLIERDAHKMMMKSLGSDETGKTHLPFNELFKDKGYEIVESPVFENDGRVYSVMAFTIIRVLETELDLEEIFANCLLFCVKNEIHFIMGVYAVKYMTPEGKEKSSIVLRGCKKKGEKTIVGIDLGSEAKPRVEKKCSSWKFAKLVNAAINSGISSDGDENDITRMRVSGLGELRVVDFTKAILAKKMGEVLPKDDISKRLFLTFGIGHAVHWFLQNLITSQKKKIFGNWKGEMCGHKFMDIDPISCPVCDKKPALVQKFIYQEPYLFYGDGEKVQIGGHPDVIKIVDAEDPWMAFVTDIKTINDMGFDRVKSNGPHINHIVQVAMYMFLLRQYTKKIECLKKIGDIHGRVYYLNKNDSSEIEFGIKEDQTVVDRCLLMYDFYKTCMEAGEIVEGCDLEDLNKTVVEKFGKEFFLDCWYAV
ncbi:MAG: hypothetical protein HQK96_05565 [Nitrospirae bacterium]|nr:hypothetical protein [Nitrospirota bacterium]